MIIFLIFNYGNICCLGEGLEFSLSFKGVMGISACYIFLNSVYTRAVKHTVFGCGVPYICSSMQFIDYFYSHPMFFKCTSIKYLLYL